MTDDIQAKLEKLKRIEERRRARSRRFLAKAKESGRKQLSAIISGEAYNQLCRIRDLAQKAGEPTSFGQIIEQAMACYTENLKRSDDTTIVDINATVEQKQDNTDDKESDNINGTINQDQIITEDQTQTDKPADAVLETVVNDGQAAGPAVDEGKKDPGAAPDAEQPDKKIRESQIEMFDAEPETETESDDDILELELELIESEPTQGIELPDYLINVPPDLPIEERHKIILRLKEEFPGSGKGIPQKRIDMLNAAGVLLGGKPWKTTKQFGDQVVIARRWAKGAGYKPE